MFLAKGCKSMNLMYLSQEAIDDIKMNYDFYKSHFTDKTNQWFMDYFKKKDWIHESKFTCKDLNLAMDENVNNSDTKNVRIVYEAMKDLSPSIALDERIWAGMIFAQLWDYVQYRRGDKIKSGRELDVLNSFLFMRGKKRSCFINCLSRLWWTGFLLYDDKSKNHYWAVDLITENAFPSYILLISSNNFAANKEVILGILTCISEMKNKGEIIKREHFIYTNKCFNCAGSVTLLDTMTREESKEMAHDFLANMK